MLFLSSSWVWTSYYSSGFYFSHAHIFVYAGMWGRVDQGAFYPSPSQAFLWTDLLERLSKYTFKSRRSGKEPGALHFLVSSQVLPKQLFQEAYTLRSKVLIILVDCRQSSSNWFFRESVVSTADGEWAPTNPDVPHHHPVPLFLPGGKVCSFLRSPELAVISLFAVVLILTPDVLSEYPSWPPIL